MIWLKTRTEEKEKQQLIFDLSLRLKLEEELQGLRSLS